MLSLNALKVWFFGEPVVEITCGCGDLFPNGNCHLCAGSGWRPVNAHNVPYGKKTRKITYELR